MADSEQRTAAAEAAAPEPQTVGQILQRARTAQGLSLEQLATELRIELPQLVALEQDKFDRIGVPVFVKGYIRHYGTRLGLEYHDLLSVYYKQGNLQEIDIRPSRTIKLRDERQITGWVVAAVVLAVIVALLLVWWVKGGGLSAFGSAAAPAAGAAAATSAAAQVRGGTGELASPAQPAAAENAASPAGAGAASDSTAATAGPAAASSVRPDPDATLVAVDLTFDQDSWAEITDARGERLFFSLGSAGQQEHLRGKPPFSVMLGNADGVHLTIAGAPYDVPASSKQGKTARFSADVAAE